MHQNLTCSLVALAILAIRNGDFEDASRLMGQASVSPDAENFLEDVLAHNLEARALVSASSSEGGLQEAVKAMSSAFQKLGEDDVDEDEMISMSFGDDIEEVALHELMDATELDTDHDLSDLEEVEEEEQDSELLDDDTELETGVRQEDVQVTALSSASGIILNLDA